MSSHVVGVHILIALFIMARLTFSGTKAFIMDSPRQIIPKRSIAAFSINTKNLMVKNTRDFQVMSATSSILDSHNVMKTYAHSMKPPRLENDIENLYNLNVGSAIDSIRRDFPLMFQQEPDLSIFTEDVTLCDRSGPLLRGKKMYSTFFSSLRIARRLTVVKPVVKVLSLRHMAWRDEICVRFSVTMEVGLCLEAVQFDAISVYRLNGKGIIYEHRIDDVTRNNLMDRRVENLLMFRPNNVLWGGNGQPIPMPMPN